MSAGHLTIKVHVRLRWWVPAYLHALAFVARMSGSMPDGDKVGNFLVRWGLAITYECA